jgi:hypothetical protein
MHDGTGWNVERDSTAPFSFEQALRWRHFSGLIADLLRAFY